MRTLGFRVASSCMAAYRDSGAYLHLSLPGVILWAIVSARC